MNRLIQLSAVALLNFGSILIFKVCDLRITTGEQFERWYDYMDNICEWAKANGCAKMEIFARPGWERILKSKGFTKTHVQIEKPL
jgi:N-acyl-L-homoserine lactone synthetase